MARILAALILLVVLGVAHTAQAARLPGGLATAAEQRRHLAQTVAKSYYCKNGTSLLGTEVANSPVKLSASSTDPVNALTCRDLCNSRAACIGFYYKTTEWCYLMATVQSFTKPYGTSYIACKPAA